jgi:hypothetical protein
VYTKLRKTMGIDRKTPSPAYDDLPTNMTYACSMCRLEPVAHTRPSHWLFEEEGRRVTHHAAGQQEPAHPYTDAGSLTHPPASHTQCGASSAMTCQISVYFSAQACYVQSGPVDEKKARSPT